MPNILEVKNLKKTYPGGTIAVKGISFAVKRGEFFGFLGPNGAGKTTTINMLVNLVKPTSGKILIDDIDVVKNPRAVHERIGIAMQEVGLDEYASAREMMQLHGRLYHMPKKTIDAQVQKLLKLMELERVADRYLSTYSGGMKRRFDLALALIHEPKVLFLDEPTTGLDPHARQLIWNHLRNLNEEGMTIFLTTHFMEEAQALCERLAIMDKGKIVAQGSPGTLIKKYRVETLEQVFLKTTGHSLAAEENANKGVDPYMRLRSGR